MFAVGFVFITLGIWLIDCAVQSRHPVATIEKMIADPTNYRTTLETSKGELTAAPAAVTSPDSGGGGAGNDFSTPDKSKTAPSSFNAPANESGGSAKAQKAIAYAKAQLGKPYRWGATGPDRFDCSGLVMMAWRAAGVNIPRTTAGQMVKGQLVHKADLQPGDLVFPYKGHVQMYLGGGRIIEAPHTGANVRIMPLGSVMLARRYG